MQHPHLENGAYYTEDSIFNTDSIVTSYLTYAKTFSRIIRDTDSFLREVVGKKRILLEGAQGNMLSVDYGTYPFVTASDCSVAGLAKGVGLTLRDVDHTLGIAKAFYMTRVGEGPFPTEMGGVKSEQYCASKGINRESEGNEYSMLSVNDPRDFQQGVAIRIAGDEYGATTGRPRRIGWLDLPLLRYSKQFTGKNIALMKLDVLNNCSAIKICTSYQYEGPTFRIGNAVLKKGTTLIKAIPASEVLAHCVPNYREFPGWTTDVCGIRTWDELPYKLKEIVFFIEAATEVDVTLLSVGPDRQQTIIRG